MTHDQTFDRAYWEDRYGAPGLTWSGAPNAVLVTEVTGLKPGRALDIGSGEGGDALWLAQRGWQVTGIDISQNALDKARDRLTSIDATAASRVEWQQRDLTEWSPEPSTFDLVSSHFMHLPRSNRDVLFSALAAAVAPGGTLLIVGHDISGMDIDSHRAHQIDLMFSIDEVLAAVGGLTVEVAESRKRVDVAMTDIVVRATRALEVDPA